jgi:hypothetical protein
VVTVAVAGTIVTIEASKIIWRTLARTDSTICTSGFYVGTKCTCLLVYMKTAVPVDCEAGLRTILPYRRPSLVTSGSIALSRLV